jgi:Ca2+-binding RTX toxin-like protein
MPDPDYYALLSGNYWNGIEVPALDGSAGAPIIVTFSFPTTIPAYDSTVAGFTQATLDSFSGFTTQEQTQALAALNEWASASGLVFVQVAPGQGDINFGNVDFNTTDNPSYAGAGGIGFYPFGDWNSFSYPYFSGDLTSSGDVFMNDQFLNDGTVAYGTLLHEIGHAIGLKHPDEVVTDYAANPVVTHDQTLPDDPALTIMATVGDDSDPDPHIKALDKEAAAALYGSSGGSVVTTSASGSNAVSSWTWNAITQTLTQTATGTSEVIHGTSVDDVIVGSSGDDTLLGLAGDDTITGGDGNDKIYGGTGLNTLIGGKGDDTYYVDASTDVIVENAGEGNDAVYATVSYTLPDNLESLSVFGVGLTAKGNNQGDSLFGDGTNATHLIGGAAADYIVGGSGNDTIAGGGGADVMWGEGGADTFVFTSLADAPADGSGVTTIGDFTPGTDKLDVSAIHDSNGQPLHFSGAGPFDGTPGDIIEVPDAVGGNSTVEGDVNGDGVADFEIYLDGTTGTPALTSSDFIFTPLCFLAGTRIATPDGERPVEALAPGDMVRTAAGAVRRVVWIGHGKHRATRGQRTAATPVLIAKGALADNVPCRDLRVTKAHALFLDGMLVPAEFLVNHRSIRWDDHAQEVVLYHVELESHDVLLADGAPAESYRDDGNRWLFANANSGWGLPPQPPCAPVVTGGPVLDALWRRLLDRAGPRPGWQLTDEPDLHLMVGGKRVEPAERDGQAYSFRLDDAAGPVRLCSRAAAPQELGVVRDPRILGAAVTRISVRAGEVTREAGAADAALRDGFYAYEPDDARRWTDGDALLPATLLAGVRGPVEVTVQLTGRTVYPLLAA